MANMRRQNRPGNRPGNRPIPGTNLSNPLGTPSWTDTSCISYGSPIFIESCNECDTWDESHDVACNNLCHDKCYDQWIDSGNQEGGQTCHPHNPSVDDYYMFNWPQCDTWDFNDSGCAEKCAQECPYGCVDNWQCELGLEWGGTTADCHCWCGQPDSNVQGDAESCVVWSEHSFSDNQWDWDFDGSCTCQCGTMQTIYGDPIGGQ